MLWPTPIGRRGRPPKENWNLKSGTASTFHFSNSIQSTHILTTHIPYFISHYITSPHRHTAHTAGPHRHTIQYHTLIAASKIQSTYIHYIYVIYIRTHYTVYNICTYQILYTLYYKVNIMQIIGQWIYLYLFITTYLCGITQTYIYSHIPKYLTINNLPTHIDKIYI